MRPRSIDTPLLSLDLRHAVLGASLIMLAAACAAVPTVQRAVRPGHDGVAVGAPLQCDGGVTTPPAGTVASTLPGPDVGGLSWNLHADGDPRWRAGRVRFAAVSALLLILEAREFRVPAGITVFVQV